MSKVFKKYCKLCEKDSLFVRHVNDKDTFICSECGFITDFGKFKLVINQFGFYFVKNERNEMFRL